MVEELVAEFACQEEDAVAFEVRVLACEFGFAGLVLFPLTALLE